MVFNRDNKKEGIFRQESLERLSSPERLDQLMQVLAPKDWLALSVFGCLTILGGGWSIIGRIPITVQGRAIFLQPRQVVDLQSSIAGQLKSLNISSGHCVKKDEVLATIEPVALQQQLRLAKEKLDKLQKQATDASLISSQRMQLEKSAIAASQATLEKSLQDTQTLAPILKEKGLNALDKQRVSLMQRLQETQAFAPRLKEKELTAIQQQRSSLQQRLKDAKGLIPVLEQRLQQRRELAREGAISVDSVLELEREYKQEVQKFSELAVQQKQLDLTETQTQQTYQQNVNKIGEMQSQLQELELQSVKNEREYLENLRSSNERQAQLQELNTKYKRLEQESLETFNQRNKEVQEAGREIIRLEQQLTENSRILSSQDGCILEVMATVGQVVQPGSRLGNMRVGREEKLGLAIAYFPIKDGKQIKPEMTISITPDTVQRERFGGIVGKVTAVSPLPVTAEGTATLMGNSEVAKNLTGETGAAIQVTVNLETEERNPSGYKWSSSKGSNSKITPGTTATVRVTIEERAPITFLLPFLRELVGMK